MSVDNQPKDITSSPAADDYPIEKTASKVEGLNIDVSENDSRHGNENLGKYRRTFLSRHIQIVTLGSNIGSGLYISTGKALRNAGPGNMIIGYTLVMTMVIAALQTLTEMTVAFPVSGNIIDYADRFVDPALAFALGFGEWLAWTTVLAAEGAAFNVIVQYWTYAVPVAVWMTICLLITFVIHAMPNRVFAEVQYVTSILKVAVLLLFIVTSCVMIAGGGPTGTVHDGQYWRELPVFLHNVKGTSLCAIYAIWGVGDQVFVGIMGGEAKNPRFSMPRAVKSVGVRIFLFFMLIVIFITLLIPETDKRLLGGGGSIDSSPLVIALQDSGIKVVPDILNAIMLIGIASGGLEPMYIASRVVRHMALKSQLPKFFARIDDKGRPTWALFVTALFTILFTYLNCSNTGGVIFTWFSSISSTIYMMVWVIMAICSIRFHAAVRAQKSTILQGRYAYTALLWPLGPLFLGTSAFLVLVGLFAASLYPVDAPALNAYAFFENYLGVPLVLAAYVGFKVIFKTKFRKASEIDLVTGYKPCTLEDETFLDNYRALPLWKRVWSYISSSTT